MAFYQQTPFYNPKIPFTGSIQGGLQDGKSIIISGQVLPNANRFHVNLQCGSRSGADIALHFNPRYDSGPGYIVTNTYQHSNWGKEERIHQSVLPSGHPFTLLILVMSNSYKISVNGVHVKDYNHRIPFHMVDTIVVDGMVVVNSIAFQNPAPSYPPIIQAQAGFQPQYAFPAGSAPSYPPIIQAQAGYQPQYAFPPGSAVPPFSAPASFTIPYKTIISGGLAPGKNISIQGVINPQANRFMINLRHRSGIAFHYNPRFDENQVVRNTQAFETWGSEERSGNMPFLKGHQFQMVISCSPYDYNVFVNGQQVHTYKHRFTNLHEIDVLEVNGDLTLSSVHV